MKILSKILVLIAVLSVFAGPAIGADLAKPSFEAARVQWDAQSPYERLVLTVSTPGGRVVRQEVGAGQTPEFDLSSAEGALDGVYTWELRLIPKFDAGVRNALAEARRTGDDAAIERMRAEGKVPAERVQSGSFIVEAGSIVASDEIEKSPKGIKSAKDAMKNVTAADQVIPDDLIVQGSACVGFDCVNNESFGFDTIRLKENSTRIKFEDTSAGSFPSNDWQLTANDSASGGANKFSIEDITGSKVPFTITAGAATNSIFVDSTGRLGLRTATPVLDIHISTSNTPAMRLEQTSAGGFTAQTWDVAGNEANFFVRDVTGGSRLPFRIRPGAPTSSIDISADGDVGVGTASPSAKLHASASTGALTTMIQMTNNSGSRLNFEDTAAVATWGLNNSGGTMNMIKSGAGVTAFTLQGSGALTIAGALTQNSNRDVKSNITEVNPEAILAKVAQLPISTWIYKADEAQATHLGPMAQDFAAAFGLGEDNLHIALGDMAGVSLAAVQALNKQVSEKDAEIVKLQEQNAEMAQRLSNLETLVNSLASQKQ
jgi:hypothetical protein